MFESLTVYFLLLTACRLSDSNNMRTKFCGYLIQSKEQIGLVRLLTLDFLGFYSDF